MAKNTFSIRGRLGNEGICFERNSLFIIAGIRQRVFAVCGSTDGGQGTASSMGWFGKRVDRMLALFPALPVDRLCNRAALGGLPLAPRTNARPRGLDDRRSSVVVVPVRLADRFALAEGRLEPRPLCVDVSGSDPRFASHRVIERQPHRFTLDGKRQSGGRFTTRRSAPGLGEGEARPILSLCDIQCGILAGLCGLSIFDRTLAQPSPAATSMGYHAVPAGVGLAGVVCWHRCAASL